MKSLELKNNIHWIGELDPNLRVFDIIMHTKFGTTYNSYFVKGTEKTALVETVKAVKFDDYLKTISKFTKVEDIDYIIVDHTEPDHAGSIEKLLELNPNITIVASSVAISYLKEITNKSFNSIAVNDGDTLSLGDKTLKFISAPNLHWPDSMYTYVVEDEVLFTCDSFGAHYSFEGITNDKIENEADYLEALEYYYNMIFSPFKPYILKAIAKIEALNIDIICPGHGPVLVDNPMKVVETYKKWSQPSSMFTKTTVVMPYVSAYGYTEIMAKEIARGIESVDNIDVRLHDMVTADFDAVSGELLDADGILLGSPTINCEALMPIYNLTTAMFPLTHKGKFASAFGSYGWSGEAVPHLIERLNQLKMKVVGDGLRIKFKPSEEQLKQCFDFGVEFATALLQ